MIGREPLGLPFLRARPVDPTLENKSRSPHVDISLTHSLSVDQVGILWHVGG